MLAPVGPCWPMVAHEEQHSHNHKQCMCTSAGHTWSANCSGSSHGVNSSRDCWLTTCNAEGAEDEVYESVCACVCGRGGPGGGALQPARRLCGVRCNLMGDQVAVRGCLLGSRCALQTQLLALLELDRTGGYVQRWVDTWMHSDTPSSHSVGPHCDVHWSTQCQLNVQ
jgi:hypothetical protein